MTDEAQNQLATTGIDQSMVPAFMQDEEVLGVENARLYQTRPYLTHVQGSSGKERKTEFGEGASILVPDGLMVSEPEGKFIAIPLFFWPVWEERSDHQDKSQPMVLSMSADPSSELAQRSRNAALRQENYSIGNNQYTKRFVEVLNFIVLIDSGPAEGELAIMSYSGGDHRVGKRLNKLLAKRADRNSVSIFANRIEFQTNLREYNDNEWWGWDHQNPTDGSPAIVQNREQYEKLKALHLEAKASVEGGAIGVDRGEEETVGDGGGGGDSTMPPL